MITPCSALYRSFAMPDNYACGYNDGRIDASNNINATQSIPEAYWPNNYRRGYLDAVDYYLYRRR